METSLDGASKQINLTSPVSEEERLQYLAELQAETTDIMMPTIVFTLLLAVIGLIGNSIVIIVYSLKFKQSATRVLIISIAVFDLLTNVLSIPGDIWDMLNLWNFDNPTICRVKILFMTFPTISSALALVAVAVVRYRKICTPHQWQITTGKAKHISTGVAILGIVVSIPSAIINGRQTMSTSRADISGYACIVDDDYVPTVWPVLNYGLFLVLYICGCVPLTVLYLLIGKQAWKHRKNRKSPSRSAATTTQIESNSSSNINQSKQTKSAGGILSMRQLDSTESTAISSTSNEDIPNKQLELTDLYTDGILTDQVEHRTQMMRANLAYLKKATPGLGEVSGNRVATEDGHVTYTENVKDVVQEIDCDLVTGVQQPDHGSDWVSQNGVRCNDVRPVDTTACLHPTGIVPEKDGSSCPGCNAEIRPTRVCPFYTNQQTRRTSHPLGVSTELTKAETTFTANSKTASEPHTIVDFSFTNTSCTKPSEPHTNVDFGFTNTSCTKPLKQASSGAHSLTSDPSQTLSDLPPLAVLKWLDPVCCQEEGQTAADIDVPKAGNSLPFRISSSNNRIQQTDSLRNVIVEALTESLSGRSGEGTEAKQDENVELGIIDNRNNKTTDERDHEGISLMSVTQSNSTLSPKTRLKKFIARKCPILKIRSKDRSKRQIFNRTTVMLFIISAIYVLGYLPHLGLMIFEFSAPEEFEAMTITEFKVYNFFVRTIFVNSAVNPIIYSLCDNNFRRESIGLFSKFFLKIKTVVL